MKRRTLFKTAFGALLAPAATPLFAFPAAGAPGLVPALPPDSEVLLRFGYLADPHYSDRPDRTDPERGVIRAYRDSLARIREAAALFSVRNAAFAIELGDFKDMDATRTREGTLACLDAAESAFSEFSGPRYHVIGNHDCDLISLSDFLAHTENTGEARGQNYYAFETNGVKCLVLDACYNGPAGDHYAPGHYDWKIAWIPDAELEWLSKELASGTGPVLVFLHQLLNYWDAGVAFKDRFVVRNARVVVDLLEGSGRVQAVFSGHYHKGFFTERNGIRYIVAKAMVTKPLPYTAGAIVTLDRHLSLFVEGFGKERSHACRKA